jgi:predicted dehydrogenase
LIDAYLRLVGENGVIEIQPDEGPPLRIRTGGGWRAVDTGGESVYGPAKTRVRAAVGMIAEKVPGVSRNPVGEPSHYERAIEHVVESLAEGTEPLIAGRRAIRGTELIFASYESSRRRGAVDLPLDVEDNPLVAMYEDDRLQATPK